MLELDEEAHLRNLTIVSGGSATVVIGGFFTGGGYGALSSTYGMAADLVLEMEIVTPGCEILSVNECQNTDLFWAMRGVCICVDLVFLTTGICLWDREGIPLLESSHRPLSELSHHTSYTLQHSRSALPLERKISGIRRRKSFLNTQRYRRRAFQDTLISHVMPLTLRGPSQARLMASLACSSSLLYPQPTHLLHWKPQSKHFLKKPLPHIQTNFSLL